MTDQELDKIFDKVIETVPQTKSDFVVKVTVHKSKIEWRKQLLKYSVNSIFIGLVIFFSWKYLTSEEDQEDYHSIEKQLKSVVEVEQNQFKEEIHNNQIIENEKNREESVEIIVAKKHIEEVLKEEKTIENTKKQNSEFLVNKNKLVIENDIQNQKIETLKEELIEVDKKNVKTKKYKYVLESLFSQLQFEEFVAQLRDEGLNIEISKIKFNRKGKLEKIKGFINKKEFEAEKFEKILFIITDVGFKTRTQIIIMQEGDNKDQLIF